MTDLSALRQEYTRGGLVEADAGDDPLALFRRWYDEVTEAGLYEPNAMTLATATQDGAPSVRMVLLKGFDEGGFVFFTNAASRKGRELAENPRAALLFGWHPLERQVRIEGPVEPLSAARVEEYFARRPLLSRLGAWASRQSRPVADREELDAAFAAAEERFGDDVPVPEDWGGYRVAPESMEFWQGRPGRMHDRIVFTRSGAGWSRQRLAP